MEQVAKLEYRIVWQRKNGVQLIKHYRTRRGAEKRYALLTSVEPWKAIGRKATDYVCCDGSECDCEGLTRRQQTAKIRRDSPLLYARFETREVGAWNTKVQHD